MTKRLNYFNGQFLKQEDFSDEQTYHRDMRKRHNTGVHTPGVVKGLEVKPSATDVNQVEITAGWAIDHNGREIILTSVVSKTIGAAPPYFATCKWQEQETDPQPEGETGIPGNRRIEESALIEIVDTAPEGVLVLATVTRDGTGKLVVTDLRQFSGIDLPGNLKISGNLEVQGQTTVVQTERIQGNVVLGDEDGDTVTVRGSLRGSFPFQDTEKLKITTSVDITGDISLSGNVDGRDVSADGARLDSHLANMANPHGTTAAQVGALPAGGGTLGGNLQVNGNVGVTGTVDGRDISVDGANLDSHLANHNNPHVVTPEQIGALRAASYDIKTSGRATIAFSNADADGATRTITLNFRPKFVWVEAVAQAVLGDQWCGLSLAGHADLRGSAITQTSIAPKLRRLPTSPYLLQTIYGFFNAVCYARFENVSSASTQVGTIDLGVRVSNVTDNSITLAFMRTPPSQTQTSLVGLTTFNFYAEIWCLG